MTKTVSNMSPVQTEDEDMDVDNQMTVTSLSGKPLLDFISGNKAKSKVSKQLPKWSPAEVERLRKAFVAPDGGYGWFIAIGAFVVQFWVAGLIKSYGVIYLEVLQLFPDASAYLASWIPAVLSTLCLLFAPVVSGLCQRFSCRAVVFVGGLCCCAGLTLSFFATNLIQLCFTFGVIAGIGAGLSTTPGIIMTSRYFRKRRALANGICLSGTAAGSMVIPPLLEVLVPEYGFLGSVLILGACMLHVCIAASLYRPIEVHQWIVEVRQRKFGIVNQHPEKNDETESYISDANGNDEIAKDNRKKLFSDPLTLKSTRFANVNLVNSGDDQNSSHLPSVASKTSIQSMQPADKPLAVILEGQISVNDNDNDSMIDFIANGELRTSFRRKREHSFLMYSLEDLSTNSTCVYKDSISRRASSVSSIPFHQSNKLLNKPSEISQSQETEQEARGRGCCPNLQRYIDITLVKNPLFLLLAITVMLMATGCPHMLFYMPAHATSLGYSRADAGWLLSISAIFDLAGRLLTGYVADLNLFRKAHGYIVSMAMAGIAVLCIPWATHYWVLAVIVSFYGFGLGSWFLLIPVLLSEHHGIDAIASSYGFIRMFQGAMTLAVPPFAGFLRDETGSYIPCFVFMGCSMVMGACIMFLEPCAQQLVHKRVNEKESGKEGGA